MRWRLTKRREGGFEPLTPFDKIKETQQQLTKGPRLRYSVAVAAAKTGERDQGTPRGGPQGPRGWPAGLF